jgi:hypothetical protein
MKIYLILITLLFIGFSCTDLEEEVYDSVPQSEYPENDIQVNNIGLDAYAVLRDLIDDNGWWYLAQEITSDEFCGPTRDADWADGGKWVDMHRHTWTDDTEGVNRMWEKMWKGIPQANKAIELLKTLAQNETTQSKIAELEVLRSFYYYLLIDNYGDVPYLTKFAGAAENPFKIKKEDIFDSITEVVQNNISRLKDADTKYQINKYTAYALLAKLYMNAETYTGTAQWALADMYIDSVLNGPYQLNVSSVLEPFMTDNESSSEIIFSIPFDEGFAKGFRIHMRSLHYQHRLTFNMTAQPWNGLCITPTHFDTYSSNDIRKKAYNLYGPQYEASGAPLIDGTTEEELDIDPKLPALVMLAGEYTVNEYRNTGARLVKFEIADGAGENLSNDFPIFRLSDFNLMKAEAQIRLGGAGSGDQWITPIRERAGIGAANGFGLDSLLVERGRELYCEGHRRQDLIRFEKFTDPWWEKGGTYDGVSGDPSVETFPIPLWATEQNPNLLADPQ